jgi:soluble lytic murein transglycosylase-like protein
MPDRLVFRTKRLWRIGVAVISIWIIPTSLWSQVSSVPQPAHSATDQPFAIYNDSLTEAADALLVSAPRVTIGVTGKASVDETPSASHAIQYDRRPQFWSEGPGTAAAARLNLLRPAIDPILKSRGVPTELAAVILVESGGRPTAISPKGARGLWQLMPDTARRYGLRVDDTQDDRIDLFRSTDAAARYLHDLYAQFGDWKLALAAYNTGEANVGSAILRAHTQDFDQLTSLRMLPLETRNYVPAVLAATRSFGQNSFPGVQRPTPPAITVFAVSSR